MEEEEEEDDDDKTATVADNQIDEASVSGDKCTDGKNEVEMDNENS